jgi:N-acetylneuraminic acid mutarotase
VGPLAVPDGGPLPDARGEIRVKHFPGTARREQREWLRVRARGLAKRAPYSIHVDDPSHPGGEVEFVVNVITRRNGRLDFRMHSKWEDMPGLLYGDGNPKMGLPHGAGLVELAGRAFELRDPLLALVLRGTVPDLRASPPGPAWVSKAPMPHPRMSPGAAVQDGIIFVVGGFDGWSMATTNDAYDPATDTWSGKAPMPTGRTDLGVAAAAGLVYAIGGNAWNGATAAVEAYDPATDSWSAKAPLQQARSCPAVAVLGGKIYVAGGLAGLDNFLSSVEVYDPALDSWSFAAELPEARAYAAGAEAGAFHVLGGISSSGLTGAHEVLDPGGGGWTPAAGMPTARERLAAAVLEGKLYAVGGYSTDALPYLLGVVEIYDPLTGAWTEGPPLNTPRSSPALAVVDGRLYVFGGLDSLYHLDSVEVLEL